MDANQTQAPTQGKPSPVELSFTITNLPLHRGDQTFDSWWVKECNGATYPAIQIVQDLWFSRAALLGERVQHLEQLNTLRVELDRIMREAQTASAQGSEVAALREQTQKQQKELARHQKQVAELRAENAKLMEHATAPGNK